MIGQPELLNLIMPWLETQGIRYKKSRHVFARPAVEGELVSTVTADGLETVNRAVKGDFVVKNNTEAGELYVLSHKKFTDRYAFLKPAGEGFDEYEPIGQIIALELTPALLEKTGLPESFHFEAPWGEAMIAKQHDFLACPESGGEVYRIARKEFFETYTPLSGWG